MDTHTARSGPACTVRRHPSGGFTPVLHAAGAEAPAPTDAQISLPDIAHAVSYARNHYGVRPADVTVAPECERAAQYLRHQRLTA